MCGIVGLWDTRHNLDAVTADAAIQHMMRTLFHRGPDDEGFFQDEIAGIALGFRRLSIVDLSPHGHQPMTSVSGEAPMVTSLIGRSALSIFRASRTI